jgi:hypothetical protein
MKVKISIIVLCLLHLTLFSQSSYKVIKLCNDEITLSVPIDWKEKENAMEFAVYEIKYDVAVKNPKNQSGLALYKYGSKYGPKMQITDSIVEITKESMLSDPVRGFKFEESGVRTMSGIKVGYLKYTFKVSNKFKFNRAYGLEVFFCNKRNIFYKIVFEGLNKPVDEFKSVAEKVFESLVIQ